VNHPAASSTTETADPPQGPTISPVIEGLRDFSDRLSPIVVKELRQGLRQPTFVILFLFLQGILALTMLFTIISTASSSGGVTPGGGSVVSGFIFTVFGIAVLIIQPLRGLGALVSEMRMQTMDMLMLTRLNAWRITFGKWLGIVIQSGLMLVAIIPYLVMRYFLGGMELFSELLTLFWIFYFSMALCAVTVGLSSISSIIIRGAIAASGLLALFILPNFIMYWLVMGSFGSGSGGGMFSMGHGVMGYDRVLMVSGYVLLLAFIGYMFLELGATRIAPPAENRSIQKRVVGILALIVIPGLFYMTPIHSYISLMLIGGIMLFTTLTESPHFTRSVVRGLARRKGLMRLFPARLFYPGWPSGTYLVMLVIGLSFGWIFLLCFDPNFLNHIEIYVGVLALWYISFLHSALIAAWFRPNTRQPLATYMAIFLGTICISMVLLIVSQVTNSDKVALLFPLAPPIGFVGFANHEEIMAVMSLVVMVLAMVALYIRGSRYRATTRGYEQSLRDSLPDATSVPPSAVEES